MIESIGKYEHLPSGLGLLSENERARFRLDYSLTKLPPGETYHGAGEYSRRFAATHGASYKEQLELEERESAVQFELAGSGSAESVASPPIRDVTLEDVDLTQITSDPMEPLLEYDKCAAAGRMRRDHGFTPRPQQERLTDRVAQNEFITWSEIQNIHSAIAFANVHYRAILDRHLTINWTLARLSDHETAAKLFSDLMHEFGQRVKTWRRSTEAEDQPFLYVYAHENDRKREFHSYRGFHTHIVAALSRSEVIRARKWLRRWLTKRCGGYVPESVLYLQIPGQFETRAGRVLRQWIFFRYLMKGLNPHNAIGDVAGGRKLVPIAEGLQIHRLRRSHPIYCHKRVGCCEALSKKSRASIDFVSPIGNEMKPLSLIYDDFVAPPEGPQPTL